MNDKQILSAAIGLIERGWTKAPGACLADGSRCYWLHPEATNVCADAALLRVFASLGEAAGAEHRGFSQFIADRFHPFLQKHFGISSGLALADYNEEHSQQEVLEMFRRARDKCQTN